MAHRRLVPTDKKLFGRTIFKPDPKDIENAPLSEKFKAQGRNTRRQLEILERQALVKRARAKGKRIRSKTRLSGNPTN